MSARRGGAKRQGPARTRARRPAVRRPPRVTEEPEGETIEGLEERLKHPEADPSMSGGDVDADWQRAASTGEETVGGSVATPDQDVVDEIGRALGVEQESDAEVLSSEEILRTRDRHYWHLERRAADREDAGEEEAS